jgi:hypothetical protein
MDANKIVVARILVKRRPDDEELEEPSERILYGRGMEEGEAQAGEEDERERNAGESGR